MSEEKKESACAGCSLLNTDADHALCTTSVASSLQELYETFQQNGLKFVSTNVKHAEVLLSFMPKVGESVLLTLTQMETEQKAPFDPNNQESVERFKRSLAQNDPRFFRPQMTKVSPPIKNLVWG